MKYIKFSSFLLLFAMLMVSCRDDQTEIIDEMTDDPIPVIKVETKFNGQVIDYNADPLSEVTITLDQSTTTTDENGFFEIGGLANQNGAFIKATKTGYWEAYGNVIPSKDGTAFVRFKLKERTAQGIIMSDQDQTVSLENQSEIRFSANSFVDQNGQPYSGTVQVFAEYLDPTASDFSEQMPGDLSAVNLESEERILQSFGMLNVELETEGGQPLNISEAATLTFDIPESLAATAPEEIPLWYFDDEDGLWKEEGSAILVDGYYRGDVNHFTLWNCDVPMPYVVLTGNVAARGPLANSQVYVTWVEEGQTLSTHADEFGDFSGKVPADAVLVVSMFDQCNNIIYEEEIGPLTEDFFLQIIIDVNTVDVFTVSGTLTCEGNPVSDGYVIIQPEGANYQLFAQAQDDGTFSLESFVCDATTFTLTGIDVGSNEQGEEQSFTIADNVEVGNVEACGIELEYFVQVELEDGSGYILPNPTVVFDEQSADSIRLYIFEFVHEFTPDDAVEYSIIVADWNSDPNDPLYGMATEYTIIGNPGVSYLPLQGEIFLNDFGPYVELELPQVVFTEISQGTDALGSFFIRALKE